MGSEEMKKDRIVRIVIPADDEVANAFLDSHGQQRSMPIRMLMHMFVAEYGSGVDVLSVYGQALNGTGKSGRKIGRGRAGVPGGDRDKAGPAAAASKKKVAADSVEDHAEDVGIEETGSVPVTDESEGFSGSGTPEAPDEGYDMDELLRGAGQN